MKKIDISYGSELSQKLWAEKHPGYDYPIRSKHRTGSVYAADEKSRRRKRNKMARKTRRSK